MMPKSTLFIILTSFFVILSSSCAQIPTIFVGSTMSGHQDGIGQNVKFGSYGIPMAIDKDGNLFVGDTENSMVVDNKRKILYISNYKSFSIYKVKL
jgi:hypothetical protein